MRRRFAALALGLGILAGSPWSGDAFGAAAREVTIHDDLAAQLRKALDAPPARMGRQFASLAALRSLRDEKLQPLFADLATRPRADLRSEGVLGLAELSADGNISLAMVGEIKNPSEQSLVILAAMAIDRLADAQVADLLTWPKLDARLEVALRARALGKGMKNANEKERLQALSTSDNPLVQLMADTLLAQGGDKDAGTRVLAAVGKLPEDQRGAAMGPVLEMIAREKLTGAAAVVTGLLPLCVNDAQRAGALGTLMLVSTGEGTSQWMKQWSEAKDLVERIRLGMTALDADEACDAAVANALAGSGIEPCASMGRVLLALRAKDPALTADAVASLVAQGHAQATIWALVKASKLPADQATTLLLKIINWGGGDREPSDQIPKVVYEAAWRLADRDAPALAPLLLKAAARKDQPMCEALLAALLRTGTTAAWDAQKTPDFPGRTAQAMATLYEARLAGVKPGITSETRGPIASGGGFSPESDKAERLRQIALGWGGLPETHRVVAAWLALCQDGKDRASLARLLAPDATP